MTENYTDNSEVLHVIYGSRTGNSRSAAELAHEYAKFLGLKSELVNMQEFNPENIHYFRNMLISVSTHGEGDPPLAAEKLLAFLSNGAAPSMKGTRFSILALGDSSYRNYCKTGHDFQDALLKLGAEKIYDLQECDIDFEEDAKQWIEEAVDAFHKILPFNETKDKQQFAFELTRADESSGDAFMARVLEKRILNEASPVKKVMHVTLSLKNSGIEYRPGDSFGIYCYNSRRLADELIRKQGYDPTSVVESKKKRTMLKQELITDYELTLLTPVVLKKYAGFARSSELEELIENDSKLEAYCETSDVIDMINDFPAEISAEDLLSTLRKLPPRLYSVACSQNKYPDEVHFMVGLVTFQKKKRFYEGVGSSFLSTRVEENESVGIFLEENPKFHLPDDNNLPVIMIGAGTGLAPYRAFLQEREKMNAKGKNWLFFGEQFSKTDFFYRDELEGFVRKGVLTRLDTAFSRDQAEKYYVTHRMLEHSKELYRWIREGAIVYLCGNKNKLAVSAREALHQILISEGNMSREESVSHLNQLKAENRFREDVY